MRNRSRRATTCVLVMALSIGLLPALDAAAGTTSGAASIAVPVPAASAATAPAAAEEVVAMRTRDAKHFRNPDGTFTAVFGHYLHYQSAPGRWDDVDLSCGRRARTS